MTCVDCTKSSEDKGASRLFILGVYRKAPSLPFLFGRWSGREADTAVAAFSAVQRLETLR
jgi:hypothetical protein